MGSVDEGNRCVFKIVSWLRLITFHNNLHTADIKSWRQSDQIWGIVTTPARSGGDKEAGDEEEQVVVVFVLTEIIFFVVV